MNKEVSSPLQQKLQELKQSVVELESVVEGIPSFISVVKRILRDNISNVVPGLAVEEIYINRQGLEPSGSEQIFGSVVDVFLHGLSQGYTPSYKESTDGVYDRPGVYTDEFRVKGLGLSALQSIVSENIINAPIEIRQYLENYWKQSAGLDAQGRSRPSRFSVMLSCMEVNFWNEISLARLTNEISGEHESRINMVVNNAGVPVPVYGVFLDTIQHGSLQLMQAFVVNLSGVTEAEIKPGKDYYHYALYTAGCGLERFISSEDMHRELMRRVGNIKDNAELVKGLPISLATELRDPPRIRFQRIDGNVIHNGLTVVLEKQKNELTSLLKLPSDYGVLASLEWTQQLGELLATTRNRYLLLQERVRKLERPEWFVRASTQQQQQYSDLERVIEKDEIALRGMLGEVASLRDFSSAKIKSWAQSAFGTLIEPSQIVANIHHEFKLGRRMVIQKDSYVLTDFVLYGLHDQGHRSKIELKGSQLPAGLNQANLERWLGNQDVRSAYHQELRKRYSDPKVRSVLVEIAGRRTALTLLGAVLQHHISDHAKEFVERAHQGDQSIALSRWGMTGARHPLKDIVMYRRRGDLQGNCVIYAPNSPGGKTWYEYSSQKVFENELASWTSSEKGRDYIMRKSRPEDRAFVTEYLARIVKKPTEWRGISVLELAGGIGLALANIVASNIDFVYAEEEVTTTSGYRNSEFSQKQYFSRLTTELKALHSIGCNEAKLISYEKFAYNLIKSRVESVLTQAGNHGSVDPDRIMIELESGGDITLSQLIIKEQALDFGGRNFVYPRFSLKTAPAVQGLDIRQVISWSKTLRPGEKYIDMLKETYLNESNSSYALRVEHHRSIQLHEMHKAALSELFQGRLSKASYLKMVSAIEKLKVDENNTNRPAFDYPDSPPREGVYHFHLEDRLVEGVYVFRSLESGRVTDLLYTPNSPDGKWLRPLEEFVASVKHQGLGQYFYDRVMYKDQRVIGTYINNLEVSNSAQATPKLRLNSRVTDFSKSYAAKIERVISDVDEKTKSLGEIISGLVYESVILAASVISIVLPPVGMAVTAVQVAKGVLDGRDAYNDGDRAAAFTFFRDALIELATAGVGALPGSAGTKATIFSLIGDVNTLSGLFTSATGQKLGPARLLELMSEMHQLAPVGGSSTVLK